MFRIYWLIRQIRPSTFRWPLRRRRLQMKLPSWTPPPLHHHLLHLRHHPRLRRLPESYQVEEFFRTTIRQLLPHWPVISEVITIRRVRHKSLLILRIVMLLSPLRNIQQSPIRSVSLRKFFFQFFLLNELRLREKNDQKYVSINFTDSHEIPNTSWGSRQLFGHIFVL